MTKLLWFQTSERVSDDDGDDDEKATKIHIFIQKRQSENEKISKEKKQKTRNGRRVQSKTNKQYRHHTTPSIHPANVISTTASTTNTSNNKMHD